MSVVPVSEYGAQARLLLGMPVHGELPLTLHRLEVRKVMSTCRPPLLVYSLHSSLLHRAVVLRWAQRFLVSSKSIFHPPLTTCKPSARLSVSQLAALSTAMALCIFHEDRVVTRLDPLEVNTAFP